MKVLLAKISIIVVIFVMFIVAVVPGQSADRGPAPTDIAPTPITEYPKLQPTPMPDEKAAEESQPKIFSVDTNPLAEELNRVLGIPLKELQKLDAMELLAIYKENADKLGGIVLDSSLDKESGEAILEQTAGSEIFKAPSFDPAKDSGYPAPGGQSYEPESISSFLTTIWKMYLPLVMKQEPSLEDRIAYSKTYAKAYIDNLYQDNTWWGYVKEYPGIPVSIKNTQYPYDYRSKRFLGHYYQTTSQPVGKVVSVVNGYDYEAQYITFEEYYNWGYGEPNLFVMEVWDEYGESTIYIQKVSWTGDTDGYEDVYVGDLLVWQDVYTIPDDTTVGVYLADDFLPASRYTVRHATKVGSYFYNKYNDPYKVQQLTYTFTQYGFTSVPDIYAPLFGASGTASNTYFFNTAAYHDCDLVNDGMDSTMSFGYGPYRYPYESKVCVLGRTAYIALSRLDYLIPALQAIHVLNKYGNPDYSYTHPSGSGTTTPRQIARWLETKWNGYGIPVYLKDSQYASAIRTNAFVALESILGYTYNDTTSKNYADMGIEIILATQIGNGTYPEETNGEVLTSNGTIYRPQQTGAQLLSWLQVEQTKSSSSGYMYMLSPKTFLSEIIDMFSMPNETEQILISNAETTLSFWATLNTYEQARW